MTTNMNPRTVAILRKSFRFMNRYMLLMWRLDMQSWFKIAPRYSGQIMILTHTGRKSGLQRQTPLNYAIINKDIYCTAGFGSIADWYKNIMENKEVAVWLPEGCWAGIAEDVTDAPEALYHLRQVLIASGFAAFSAGINPYDMNNEELAEVTQGYRLIRIQRTHPINPEKGYRDLSWVWQVATCLLLLLIPFIKRKRH